MKHKIRFVLCLLFLLTALLPVMTDAQQSGTSPLSILVVGDWGTGGAGARRVGAAMAAEQARAPVKAVISTGDNIYPAGVRSVDDPQWVSKFEHIFPAGKLPVPFWAVLGNHDYRGDPDAQVAYTGHRLKDGTVTRWRMPARYWTTVIRGNKDAPALRLIGLDTQLLVGNAGTRKKHLAWLDSVLSHSAEKYIIVAGHHPVYSHGLYGNNRTLIRYLAPLLEKFHVLAYLDGHEHDLQLIKPVNGVRYIISGGGGGHRKTTPGKRTEFSANSLGFVRLDLFADRMRITFINDRGKTLYKTVDAIKR